MQWVQSILHCLPSNLVSFRNITSMQTVIIASDMTAKRILATGPVNARLQPRHEKVV